ncbi:MAG: TnpV protein [Synergistaceae bacterium]|nr:TnpV protein [Synergistaceae bacterium]
MAELEYVQAGDYLIPALTLEDRPDKPLGKYALMRHRHLKDNDNFQYNLLMIRGQLYSHLAEIDETAARRVESFMEEALKKDPIPEDLKNTNPLEWVGRMENLKAQAEEIVTRELIFTPPTRGSYMKERDLTEEEAEELMETPF